MKMETLLHKLKPALARSTEELGPPDRYDRIKCVLKDVLGDQHPPEEVPLVLSIIGSETDAERKKNRRRLKSRDLKKRRKPAKRPCDFERATAARRARRAQNRQNI